MGFHVLVVEDSTADTRLIRLGVARCDDCTVAFAENGEVALAQLRREPPHQLAIRPHLILLDLNLPRMSGLEFLQEFMRDPDLRTIPVVVFSGSPNPEDMQAAQSAGASGYVVKPSDLEPFVGAVAETVRAQTERLALTALSQEMAKPDSDAPSA